MAKGLIKAFGAEVRRLRKERGLSQEELAGLADLHPNYIGMIERCERVPTLAAMEGIARGFRIKVSELIAQAENRR